ncbi:Gfo/Idh/MocA family protein [Ilumatobacter fluminis]|uniref:Gfo/Idh/MocA family protein n=1 Tax=Ilumatobacter fluminis TaxID=467091 RepID=UPI001414D85A|nr:Gfo/Idh/MocA family oxidoreductase [Ilumatobacter fluminis]
MNGEPRPSDERPVIAVLGTGRWGVNLVREFTAAGASVVAVDPDSDARRRALGAGAGVATARLDRSVDAVVVSTPASIHEQTLGELTTLDVPVACEKPLAPSSAAAERIAAEWGDRLVVFHVWRHHPAVTTMAGVIASGDLGPVTAIRSTRTNWTSPRFDVDPIWTLAPHDLSIALALFGTVPDVVAASTETIGGRVVAALAHLESDDTPTFVLDVSTREPERTRRLVVSGTDGVAVWTERRPGIVRIARGTDTDPLSEDIPLDPTSALRRQADAFVERVRNGTTMPSTPADAVTIATRVEQIIRLGATT